MLSSNEPIKVAHVERISQSANVVKVIKEYKRLLKILLTPQALRFVLVCSHYISISFIINYTNMEATGHMKLCFLKSKVKFC